MSSCLVLLFLSLALSMFCSCSARHLRMTARDLEDIELFNEQRSNLGETAIRARSAQTGVIDQAFQDGAVAAVERRADGLNMESPTKDAYSGGAAGGRRSLKVSWRLHGVKEHPRIDVDYVGPRTHSPSHN